MIARFNDSVFEAIEIKSNGMNECPSFTICRYQTRALSVAICDKEACTTMTVSAPRDQPFAAVVVMTRVASMQLLPVGGGNYCSSFNVPKQYQDPSNKT
jgi:hypothetical protein